MGKKALHQVTETTHFGDATTDHMFVIRRWLREMGFKSEIYSLNTQQRLESEVRRFSRNSLANEDLIVFHLSIGSTALEQLWEQRVPLVLIYHNITPPDFIAETDPVLTRDLKRGQQQLAKIRPVTRLALAASPYSEMELKALNFSDTGVLPIVLDEAKYDYPLDSHIQSDHQSQGPLLLFVGRITPNKRQEDLIKLLYFYRRFEPEAHLVLVGGIHSKEYFSWLQQFASNLNLRNAVTFTGHITQQEMVTYYKTADIFVSMSEHEGFCKPLIESMHLGLPVMAFAATAVPSTMGDSGVLFHEKNYESLAEIVDMLVQNQPLRERIITRQLERVKTFFEPNVRELWATYLRQLSLL